MESVDDDVKIARGDAARIRRRENFQMIPFSHGMLTEQQRATWVSGDQQSHLGYYDTSREEIEKRRGRRK